MDTRPDPPPVTVQVGRCRACGQQLLRTTDDCWHSAATTTVACPPEVADPVTRVLWGDGFGRPGRGMWIPGQPLQHPVLPSQEQPEPLPPSCMAGTCVCPPTPDGTDGHHEPMPYAGSRDDDQR